MKICFLNDTDFLGGGERWVLNACRYLQSIHHHASVICPHPSALQAACEQEGVEVSTYAYHPESVHLFYETVYGHLKKIRADIIYCTVMGRFCEARVLEKLVNRLNQEPGGPGTVIILKTGLPPMDELSPEYYGAGAGAAVRRLHVVSNSILEALVDWYPPMDNGFAEVFYEGTDRQVFNTDGGSKEERKNGLRIPPDYTVVTCIARLEGIKGQSILLRAVPGILKVYPKTIFLFAGEGKDRDILEDLREDLGLGQSVRFLGYFNDIPALLGATDILCHPSLNDGIPNAIIEAMSMSVPVVASDLPGIREVITTEETGILVRPNDVQRLHTALLKAMKEEKYSVAMSSRAKKAIAGRFNFKANMNRLIDRLESELLNMKRLPGRKTAPASPESGCSAGVLFIMSEIRLGGEETELGILARYLDRKKFPLSVLSCHSSREYAPVLERLGYYNIPVDMACNHILEEDGKIHYMIEKIRREGIGIVVACQDTRLACQVFKRLSPDECILIEHGGIVEDAGRNPIDRTFRYVGVSRKITEAAARQMKTPEAALFIPSMVDTDEYDHTEWAKARALTKNWLHDTLLTPFGYAANACVVVFVGRLDPRKHAEDFIQAARILQADCPEAFFLVVGGNDSFQPEYGEQLLEDARDLTDKKRLVFTGPRSDVPGILSACNILVLPSTGEGMAHVINEAGAAGLAVVSTDDGAAREQLEDGKCGQIIAPRRIDELVAALRRLIKDEPLRRELGHRLREKVRCEYSAQRVIAQWHALFAEAAAQLKQTTPIRMSPLSEPLSTEEIDRGM